MIRLKNRKRRKVYILLLGLSIFSLHAEGQSLSLKQCIEYAQEHNANIMNANHDVDIAQKRVNEEIGTMLPQIDATGAYTNNLRLNTTVLPGEIIGQPGTNVAVQMGTQHNVTGGVLLSQKVFDPTFSIALKATKLNEEQSKQSLKLTTENTLYNIGYLYYQTMVLDKHVRSLEASLESSNELLKSTKLRFENGLAMKIDVDKIQVSHNNTESLLHQSELSYNQSLNNLKYYMGMPVDSTIVLADTVLDANLIMADRLIDNINYENRADFQLQKISLDANELEKKRNAAGYLPSLSFNAYGGYNAFRDEFDFFQDKEWYSSAYIGLSLRIPIFDGLQRQSRNAQSKLKIEKSKVNINQFRESIKVELSNSEIEYNNAIDNIRNEKSNLELAENVLKSTQLEYEQGISTALDLVQSETSYRESLNSYYRTLLSLYIAKIDFEKSKGTLTEYLNNLK